MWREINNLPNELLARLAELTESKRLRGREIRSTAIARMEDKRIIGGAAMWVVAVRDRYGIALTLELFQPELFQLGGMGVTDWLAGLFLEALMLVYQQRFGFGDGISRTDIGHIVDVGMEAFDDESGRQGALIFMVMLEGLFQNLFADDAEAPFLLSVLDMGYGMFRVAPFGVGSDVVWDIPAEQFGMVGNS